jgi:hypothetical protein
MVVLSMIIQGGVHIFAYEDFAAGADHVVSSFHVLCCIVLCSIFIEMLNFQHTACFLRIVERRNHFLVCHWQITA